MSSMPSPDLLLPQPDKLYTHLVNQLEFLANCDGEISRNKLNFRTKLSDLKNQSPETWTLNIRPNWIIRLKTDPYTATRSKRDFEIEDGYAVIGGYIRAENNQFKEYSLHLILLARHDEEVRGEEVGSPCCWAQRKDPEEWRVAKKYHFDIDIGDNDHENKPITHLQSGGNFDPDHLPPGISSDDVHYCSSPLDKPRLPHPPMDPVLLFQMVSDQYNCPDSLESEYWNSKVIAAESILWENYYQRITEHFDRDRSSPFNGLISNGRVD